MTALSHRPEPSARADTDEMRAAMFLQSKEGIDYCEALNEVRRQQYDPNPPTPSEVAQAFRFKYF